MNEPVIGSQCSGYGGLELAVQRIFGGRVAWHAEIDEGASAILKHRYPDVPNLGDICQVDWSEQEYVDILAAGFPCTDLSSAGLRAGLRPGTRSGVWNHVLTSIVTLQPLIVVVENVKGILSAYADSSMEPCSWCLGDVEPESALRALGAVLGDLADVGYDARWLGLQAADVGAPHPRHREFILAYPVGAAADAARLGRSWNRNRLDDARRGAGSVDGGDRAVAHPDRELVRHEPVGLAGSGSAAVAGDPRAQVAEWQRRLAAARARYETATDPASAEQRGPQPEHLVTDRPAPESGERAGATADPADLRRRVGTQRDSSGTTSGRGQADEPRGRRRAADEQQPVIDWGVFTEAIRRWETILGRSAPSAVIPGRVTKRRVRMCAQETGLDGWSAAALIRLGGWGPRLNPDFVEWMMGLPEGWVCDVPGLSHSEKLRALGNGVVPQQGAAALSLLLSDLEAQAAQDQHTKQRSPNQVSAVVGDVLV